MNGDPCRRPGCNGVIEDGYCGVCGLAETKASASTSASGVSAFSGSAPVSRSAQAAAATAPQNGSACGRPGCMGVIEDGYCNVCGLAAASRVPGTQADRVTARGSQPASHSQAVSAQTNRGSSSRSSSVITGTGSSPTSRAGGGSRRTHRSSSRTSRRQLGAGLISLPDLPSIEPERAILLDPKVPERKRFCAKCDSPLKREAGFCGKCGTRYSFVPSLKRGDLVAGQYEVRGPMAFGGLGWIYLAFDKLLSRYVVMKGLLNTADESAAAVAVAERQFLAAVKHPQIVGIYNFVQQGAEGFIVMEYVGGKTLKQIRQERGPLPVAEAIAYIHRILPAFAYLHKLGLVYCDFKPDNIMFEHDDVKLIDLGGVRRVDDTQGDIYGTIGYSAPEAGEGPTPLSDLYTIGRTLAVLLTDIKGFSKEHRYALQTPDEEPIFAQQESLYRFLLKSTAESADDRFEDAEEMAEQLLGVLREVVAVETGTPRPGVSLYFGTDLLALDSSSEMTAVQADGRWLPLPALDVTDPGAQQVSSAIALGDPERRAAALRIVTQQTSKSREAKLRLAGALAELGQFGEASDLLDRLAADDAWDWRVQWFKARMHGLEGRHEEARKLYDQVYFDLPGEVAPKLAMAMAAEQSDQLLVAATMYDVVSRTDNGFVSAIFGLARCEYRMGNRKAAVAALDRLPQSSSLYLRSRVEAARLLIAREGNAAPAAEDLSAAAQLAQGLTMEGMHKSQLTREILAAAVTEVSQRSVTAGGSAVIFGRPFQERPLRAGLESALREMARFVNGDEKVRLVDEANRVRPRTLV